MRAVVQRVAKATVVVADKVISGIEDGLLVLLGVQDADTQEDIDWLAAKLVQMRIFNDADGLMNLSVQDTGGNIIVVSQFTLYASTKKGNRPSFIRAARPEKAEPMYEAFIKAVEEHLGRPVGTGIFGAHMEVALMNDGPVTIIIDTQERS